MNIRSPNIACYKKSRNFLVGYLLFFPVSFSFKNSNKPPAPTGINQQAYTGSGIEGAGWFGKSIYKNHTALELYKTDEYSEFQGGLARYPGDCDYFGTNEPTRNGMASLVFLQGTGKTGTNPAKNLFYKGAVIRGDSMKKEIALVFTGDEFADGGKLISGVLQKQAIRASFFFTGNFYRNAAFQTLINILHRQGNYLGPHSDRHLLYCDWNNRDSMLVSKYQFKKDLGNNLAAIKKNHIPTSSIRYFLPPYEWYNDSIASWTKEMSMQLINYSPGTLSATDYTFPGLKNYHTTNEIYQSVMDKEKEDRHGLNGFILLLHIGSDPRRTDKFYYRLNELINELKQRGYLFKRVDELLK